MLTINSFVFVATLAAIFTVGFAVVPPGTPPEIVEALERLVSANTYWTMQCLGQLLRLEPQQPHATMIPSLLSTVAQTAIYSRGATRNAALKVINLKSREEIEQCFPIAFASLRDTIRITSTLELDVFADDGSRFCDNFTETYQQIFGGATNNVDMSDATEGAKQINELVKCQLCNGEDIITPDDVYDDPSGLNYISTSKFVVRWSPKLFPRIGQMDFFRGSTSSSVPAIIVEGEVQHAQVDSICAKVVKIALGGRWYLVLILPNEANGMPNLLQTLAEPGILNATLNSLESKNRTVSFPIPKMLAINDYKRSLQEANILVDIFDPMLCQLEGLCNRKNDYVTSIFHESYLDLTSCLKTAEPSGDYSDSDCDQFNREFFYFTMCDFRTPVHAGIQN